MSANTEDKLLLEGPAGPLETIVTRVENARAVAVICHPHPLHGGTMHNKVVSTLQRAARLKPWAQHEFPGLPLWLMGFSFGGYVAAAAAGQQAAWPERLVLVAPSVERQPFAQLLPFASAAVVMMGEADEVVAPEAVFNMLEGQSEIQLVRFADTGHFFHGKLVELKLATEAAFA